MNEPWKCPNCGTEWQTGQPELNDNGDCPRCAYVEHMNSEAEHGARLQDEEHLKILRGE